MKLVFCAQCCSVFSLNRNAIKKCDCGKSSGAYKTEKDVVFDGPSMLLYFDNESFTDAVSKCTTNKPPVPFLASAIKPANRFV